MVKVPDKKTLRDAGAHLMQFTYAGQRAEIAQMLPQETTVEDAEWLVGQALVGSLTGWERPLLASCAALYMEATQLFPVRVGQDGTAHYNAQSLAWIIQRVSTLRSTQDADALVLRAMRAINGEDG